jgi:hypothetical protein
MARALKPLTIETLQEEVRFLLKTLLRDDVFHDEIKVGDAEKLLDNSLSIGFAEHCAFLKRHGFLEIDRVRNVVVVLPRGRSFADGGADPTLAGAIGTHFAARLPAQSSSATPGATGVLGGGGLGGAGLGGGLGAGLGGGATAGGLGSATTTTAAAGATTTVAASRPPPARGGLFSQPERYQKGEVLGHGSLGPVLLGRDTTLDRDVVVKEVRHVFELVTYVPRDELVARVKSAVMMQARLDHPHVLRVVDVNFAGEAPSVVLDRAVESLASRIGRGLMPVDAVLRVLLQICYGLSAAHKQDIVHGGLKPENVLFDAAGNVRLADFGIARVAERSSDLNTSAPPVYVGRGNPSYMAPEQLHKGKASAAGDVYSLGILLYEMLTGNLPGRRSPMPSSSERVVRAVGVERVAALDDLFDRMTRDPLHERFTSIDDVLGAIYAAFPAAQVGTRGTLLLSENDALAPPSTKPAVDDGGDVGGGGDGGDGGELPVEVTAVTKAPPELRDP